MLKGILLNLLLIGLCGSAQARSSMFDIFNTGYDTGVDERQVIQQGGFTPRPAQAMNCTRLRNAENYCVALSKRRNRNPYTYCRTTIAQHQQCRSNYISGNAQQRDSAYILPQSPSSSNAVGSANCKKRTDDTMTCMICNCFNEAGNQSHQGKIEVNRTVLARILSPHYPNNACSVIWQRAQFSWTLPSIPEYNVTGRNYTACHRAVKDAIAQGSNGACFYHANYVRPGWARQKRVTQRVGAHIFYGCPGSSRSVRLARQQRQQTIQR